METIIHRLDVNRISGEVIKEASAVLQRGGMVAFPTETVYGLGADALNEKAASRIYKAKGRPSDNPLIVHISNREQLYRIAEEVPDAARKLMDNFWPGPLTMIFKKRGIVPDGTTGGLDTVAVRMPDHPVALKLIEESGIMVAAPSANTSGRPSPTASAHVEEDLYGKIDMILDGGEVGIGIESTIVDMTSDIPVILRPGYITKEMLGQVLGEISIDVGIMGPVSENTKPKAPGMKYRHYAPNAELTIFSGNTEDVVRHINEQASKSLSEGKSVGIIASEETRDKYKAGKVLVIGTRDDEDTIAHNLYRVLREFDAAHVDVIYGEAFGESGLGQAIMNRLLKASGYHVKSV